MPELSIALSEAGYTHWPHDGGIFILGVSNEVMSKFLMGALPGKSFLITPIDGGVVVEAI